ncbi:MAG TPA: hypothetical protein VFI31_22870 [Pirellulales bacterium]|nr:hypothetical protein [Pirellulales bacterium]
MFVAGAAFWVIAHNHLYFIISDPLQNSREVVHVNITTLAEDAGAHDPYNDRSCLLYPGEHPRIDRVSCVYYQGAQIASVSHLTHKLSNREIRLDDEASPQMLAKLRKGALLSEHIIPIAADLLIEQNLV